MADEEIYQVTLMSEAPAADASAEPADAKRVENKEVEEEEEEAADFDDPLAMLGGMADEEIYQVTLMSEAPTANASVQPAEDTLVEKKEEVEEEEEETAEFDDPLAMLGGMADEE